MRRTLTLSLGQKTAAGAEQFRDTQQMILSQRQWGGTIRVSPGYPLRIAGTEIPAEIDLIQAGQWIELSGLDELLQIQRCEYDYANDTATLTVSQGITQRDLVGTLIETTDAVRSGRNPVSGAKQSGT